MLSSTLTVLVVTIVVSALVAVIIQGIVLLLGRMAQAPPVAAAAVPAPPARAAGDGIPAHHLIAIAAACDTVLGHHRIVHIESTRPDSSWVALGRQMHHGSHRITRHTPRP